MCISKKCSNRFDVKEILKYSETKNHYLIFYPIDLILLILLTRSQVRIIQITLDLIICYCTVIL